MLGQFFTGLACLVGCAVYIWKARSLGYRSYPMIWVMVAGVLVGMVVARLTERMVEHAELATTLNFAQGGRTILGGVIGGWIGVEITKRLSGIKVSTGPMWAVALPAAESVGRVGCYFNGCCFGKKCDLLGLDRYPTQMIMSVTALGILGAVLRWGAKWNPFGLYLVLWSCSRFLIEFLREAPAPAGFLSLAQWACIGLFAAGCMMILRKQKNG